MDSCTGETYWTTGNTSNENGDIVTDWRDNSPVCNVEKNDTDYRDFFLTSQFVTGLIMYPILCVIGLVGNVLVLIVLSNRKMASSTNVYLSSLAVADSAKLLNDFNYFIMSVLLRYSPADANRMYGFLYAISHYIFNASLCVASWLTVCVGFDRYIAVCKPTRAKQMCTIRRSRVISSTVFLTMMLLTIPSALKYQNDVIADPTTNKTSFRIVLSPLGKNEHFMTPYTWAINLLRSGIPICILIVLNSFIILTLRRERVLMKNMSVKNRITVMLIVVILVFVLCVTPDAVMNTVFGFGYTEASCLVRGIREYSDCLLAFNSTVNFVIYCLLSTVFRRCFLEMLCANNQGLNYFYNRLANNKEWDGKEAREGGKISSGEQATLGDATSAVRECDNAKTTAC